MHGWVQTGIDRTVRDAPQLDGHQSRGRQASRHELMALIGEIDSATSSMDPRVLAE
jgi:hypothetical protein